MSMKLFVFLAWIFYLAMRQTADGVWQFCLIYSCVLACCIHFYGLENKKKKTPKKKAKSK